MTDQQDAELRAGGYVYLENMRAKAGHIFSAYVFMNDEKNKVCFSRENPEQFIKYGHYEMRVRDKRLIEAGFITRATVKWWGGSPDAHPYLWKENPTDAEYKESWSDPREPGYKPIERTSAHRPVIRETIIPQPKKKGIKR